MWHVNRFTQFGAVALLCLLSACERDPSLKRDLNGALPLHKAVQEGDVAQAEALLTKSGQANTPDLDGVCALHRAARQGDLEMAKLLLRHHAAVDQPTGDGWTAVHIATWYQQPEMVKLLLASGARTNVKTPEGMTPFHMACQKGLHDLLDVFMMDWPGNAGGARPDVDAPNGKGIPPLILAVRSGDSLTAGKLLILGASARAVDPEGNTALHLLAGKDKLPLAEDLIARGADVSAVNGAGKTPHALAVDANDQRLAELLALKGARP